MDIKKIEEQFRFTTRTCEDIGREHGTHRKKIEKLKKEHGWVRAYDDKEWLMKQYQSGLLVKDIADQLGIDRNTLCIKFRKMGIEIDRQRQFQRKYHYYQDYFNQIDTEEKAYWLGFIMADGNISSHRKTWKLTINLSQVDNAHLEKLSKKLVKGKNLETGQYTHPEHRDIILQKSTLRINSAAICKSLLEWGVPERKTGNESFPKIPKELNRHFIRGFVDGDGSIGVYKDNRCDNYHFPMFSLSSMSESILKSINKIIQEELNFQIEIKQSKNLYRIQCTGSKALKLIKWLYEDSNVYLERKYVKYLECTSEDIVRTFGEIPKS